MYVCDFNIVQKIDDDIDYHFIIVFNRKHTIIIVFFFACGSLSECTMRLDLGLIHLPLGRVESKRIHKGLQRNGVWSSLDIILLIIKVDGKGTTKMANSNVTNTEKKNDSLGIRIDMVVQ